MSQYLYRDVSRATVQILMEKDNEMVSMGTGFHMGSDDVVVTNAHVVKPALDVSNSIFASTEKDEKLELELMDYEFDDEERDYAAFSLSDDFDGSRNALIPKFEPPGRGTEVVFAGYPHGFGDLLVHRAFVSGQTQEGVYLDGSINGGNSGGPVVNIATGEVVGMVTYKRYVSPDRLQDLMAEWRKLQNTNMSGTVAIGGVNITKLFPAMAESFDVLNQVLQANANSGIGISQNIEPIADLIDDAV